MSSYNLTYVIDLLEIFNIIPILKIQLIFQERSVKYGNRSTNQSKSRKR